MAKNILRHITIASFALGLLQIHSLCFVSQGNATYYCSCWNWWGSSGNGARCFAGRVYTSKEENFLPKDSYGYDWMTACSNICRPYKPHEAGDSIGYVKLENYDDCIAHKYPEHYTDLPEVTEKVH